VGRAEAAVGAAAPEVVAAAEAVAPVAVRAAEVAEVVVQAAAAVVAVADPVAAAEVGVPVAAVAALAVELLPHLNPRIPISGAGQTAFFLFCCQISHAFIAVSTLRGTLPG
jgi:hypothetical protein